MSIGTIVNNCNCNTNNNFREGGWCRGSRSGVKTSGGKFCKLQFDLFDDVKVRQLIGQCAGAEEGQ